MTTRADLQAALGDRNLQAFLRVIREGETGQTDRAYATLVGGGQFTGWADHPRQSVWIERLQVSSTAAGAYQFLARTWDAVAQRYGLQDFSPASQDLGAVALIVGRGALDDVIAGRFEAAVRGASAAPGNLSGAYFGAIGDDNQKPVFGGGGSHTTSADNPGKSSIYGGAGGGAGSVNAAARNGGASMYGGAGGAGGDSTDGADGAAPAGAGGGTRTGATSGAGARGQLEIWGVC